jgi:hypothetical protein
VQEEEDEEEREKKKKRGQNCGVGEWRKNFGVVFFI